MFGLNLDNSIFVVIIFGYILYLIINKNFSNSIENENMIEGFKTPENYDIYDKKYKPVLKQNVDDVYNRKIKSYCLPYSLDYDPSNNIKDFSEPKAGLESLDGKNFLFAKYHSQVDNVGNYISNKKTNIRPTPVNPILGVDPWTQSIVNIDWKNDDKILQYENKNKNIWDRLDNSV
jgi:hypothetical protein